MKAIEVVDTQKVFIIDQGEEGTPVAGICRKAGISQAAYFNWKKKSAGSLPTEMERLNQLEDENSRLNNIAAGCHPAKAPRPDLKGNLFLGMCSDWQCRFEG